ncbi:MAG: hypothetical protein WD490_09540 [Opitutales bacterium]
MTSFFLVQKSWWRNLSAWVPMVALVLFMAVLMSQTQREVRKAGSEPGFAMDDSWIHASIAKNFIEGKGWGLNAGEWIPLSTAPAWTLWMAFWLFLLGEPVVAGLTAAFLCQTAAGLLAYRLMLRWTRHRLWSLLAAVLLPLHPVLLWGFASGMEHPIVAFSVVLCLYVFDVTRSNSCGRAVGLPLALLLGVLSRPELFVLVPLALLATAYQNLRGGSADLKMTLRIFALECAVFLIGIAPYFVFNVATSGKPFPTALHVKASLRDVGFFSALKQRDWNRIGKSLYSQSFDELRDHLLIFFRFNAILTLSMAVGLLSFVRPFRVKEYGRAALLLSLIFFLPLMMGVVAPNDSLSNYAHRYLAPFIPGVVLLGSLGLWAVWTHSEQKIAALICLILVLKSTAYNYKPILQMYARDVRNTNALYVDTGEWIRDNMDPTIPLAINDIGGISYFIENPILDIMGLGSPEIWPYLEGTSQAGRMTPARAHGILKYLLEHDYDYLLMSPHYYTDLHRMPHVFEPIQRWEAVFRTGRAIDPQILYRIHRPDLAQ